MRLVFVCLLLAACAEAPQQRQYWTRPGFDDPTFRMDYGQCQAMALSSSGATPQYLTPLSLAIAQRNRNDITAACLNGKGYSSYWQ